METTATDSGPNPYQPPQSPVAEVDLDATIEISFRLDRPLRRHAEAQFLLHWRPKLLLFSSLAMIFASCLAFISLPFPILFTLLLVMIGSAAIYSALVHQAKQRTRERQHAFGLTSDQPITVASAPERTTLLAGGETYAWPSDRVNVYATSKGVLICPEPFLYLFVPKPTGEPLEGYRQLVKLARARAMGARPPSVSIGATTAEA